jgi:hypothetical protein
LTKSFTTYVSKILTEDHRKLDKIGADVSNTMTPGYFFKNQDIGRKVDRNH